LGAPGEDFGEPKAGVPPSQEFFRSKRTGRQNVGLGRAVAAIRFTLARMTASGAIEPFRPDRANAYCCPQCGPCPITKQRPLGSLAKWPQRLDLLTLTPGTGAFGDPVMEVGPADDRFDPYPRQAASPSAQNLAQLTVGSCI
jgi:hypothetical protein